MRCAITLRRFVQGGACVAAVLSASAVSAGAPQQTRDAVAAPVVGTGVIAGRVMTDEREGHPVRRATVTLAAGGVQLPRTTVSGDNGEFDFAGLPPGNYTVVAQKAAYVVAFYGARRPGKGPGVAIALLEGQRVTGVTVRLLHGSVITGVVRNQSGQPVVGLDVQALPLQLAAGQRQMVMPAGIAAQVAAAGGGGGTATTDDRGVYRIYGLAPGPYVVQSRSDSLSTAETRRVTSAEVQWATQSAAQGQSASPGAAPPALEPLPASGQMLNYAPVFFPGTVDAAGATTITLAPNEERNGVDFTTLLVPTAHVTGTLVDAEGQPTPGGQITLRGSQAEAFDMLSALIGGGGSRTAQDGRFTLSDVAPGHYTITARATPRAAGGRQAPDSPLAQMPPQLLAMLGGQSASGTPMMWAMADVDVDGRDISDITLALQPGMTVSGKVMFDGAAPPADLTKVRVSLNTLPSSSSPIAMAASMMLGGTSVSVSADGSFQAKGVMPDKYRVGAASAGLLFGGAAVPAGWVLKSAMLGGRDVSDVSFDVKPNSDITGLVVTFTDRPTELSGAVIDQAGRPAPGFPIIVFSTDRAYWTIGSRRVQQARPSSDGKYKLTGLPAGEYYVSAVTDLDPNDLADPIFLEQLASTSFKITLADGEKKTTDLKLGGGGVSRPSVNSPNPDRRSPGARRPWRPGNVWPPPRQSRQAS